MRKLIPERIVIQKSVLPVLLTAFVIFSSACAESGSPKTTVLAQTVPDVTAESSLTEENTEKTIEASSEIEASSVADSRTVSTSETATEISFTTEETTESSLSDEPIQTSPSATETTTSTSAEATLVTTQNITETVVSEDLPIVIYAKSVNSPGEAVEKTSMASVDYSNASLGYISASYSGNSGRAKLRIICNDVTYDHDLSVSGNYEYFPLSQGSGDYRIQVYEQLEGKLYSIALDLEISVDVKNDTDTYLYPNKYVWFSEKSDCAKKSAELCAGKEDDIRKIAAIFTYISDNLSYDYDLAATVTSGYIPDPDTVLSIRKGICFDYASLFAAMARSQNIPARLVIGYASPDIYHAWNEVYTKETGWITPELLLKEKGYNLVDATFYSSAENKSIIAEYISDNTNYSAIYRY